MSRSRKDKSSVQQQNEKLTPREAAYYSRFLANQEYERRRNASEAESRRVAYEEELRQKQVQKQAEIHKAQRTAKMTTKHKNPSRKHQNTVQYQEPEEIKLIRERTEQAIQANGNGPLMDGVPLEFYLFKPVENAATIKDIKDTQSQQKSDFDGLHVVMNLKAGKRSS